MHAEKGTPTLPISGNKEDNHALSLEVRILGGLSIPSAMESVR